MIALLSRIFGKLKSRTYDGGGSGRRWRGAADTPNQRSAMLAARGPIGWRARYLVGNNALAASGAATWVDSIIGTGIRPMSAHPNRETRRRINAAFERWTDGADADDLGDFYALQALAVRRAVVDGECFAVMVPDRAGSRLRLMDAEQVDPTLSRDMTGGARIVQEIELDAAGRRVAYHALRDRPGLPLATSLDTVRLPAADVAHLFRPDVPGQVRGLSWFAPILLRLYDIDAAHDAQLMRQKVGALLAGFIRPSADGLLDAERKSGSIFEASLEPGRAQGARRRRRDPVLDTAADRAGGDRLHDHDGARDRRRARRALRSADGRSHVGQLLVDPRRPRRLQAPRRSASAQRRGVPVLPPDLAAMADA